MSELCYQLNIMTLGGVRIDPRLQICFCFLVFIAKIKLFRFLGKYKLFVLL